MVKRSKSPEVADDARYFTVYQPYPLNPNWLEEDDQRACAVWVAECIGPNHLWAIHEKPKARNMALLEVSKDFEDHASLLGEHRWSEFLKDPTDEEKVRVTQVFHSFYARGRDAQKDGWKVVAVNSQWFNEWAPGEDRIVHPYPSTHWCLPPVEDKTNKALCRPLPVEQKPPPPRAESTVVGSSTWVAKQKEPAPTKAALAGAWSKGAPGNAQAIEQERTSSGASTPSVQPRSPISSGASTPASPAPKGKVAWGRAVPLQKFVTDAVRANAKKTSWSPVQAAASPAGAKSPLAEEPPKGPVNAWAKPLKVPESQRAKPASAPPPKNDSQWEATDTDHGAWFVGDTPKDDTGMNTSAPDATSTSNLGAPPSSPRKGRTRDRKEDRDDSPSSPHKSRASAHTSSRRDSTSRTRAEREKPHPAGANDSVDSTSPQRGKRRQWDMPSPEQSTKHLPKPWDKKKKEKETIETMFGPADDCDAQPPQKTPDVKPMDVDAEALNDWGEWTIPRTDDKESGNKAKQSAGSPNKHKGKKTDGYHAGRDDAGKDGPKRYKRGEPRVLMEDLAPGRSAGQWDHTEFAPEPSKKKFDGKPRDTKKGSAVKKGPGKGKKANDETVETLAFGGLAMDESANKYTKMDVDAPETAWGEWGPAPSSERGAPPPEPTKESKESTSAETARGKSQTTSGKWDPSPTATENEKPDDFKDRDHVPHKAKKATAKKEASNQGGLDKGADWGGKENGKKKSQDVEMENHQDPLTPYESEWYKEAENASTAKSGEAKTSASSNWGSWSVPAPKENTDKKPTKKSKMFHDEPTSSTPGGNLEAWGNPPESKGKSKATAQDDFGIKVEDWGMEPPTEEPPKKSSKNKKSNTVDYDNLNWGAQQGNLEDWGQPPVPLPSASDDLDESEFHPWETNAAPDLSAWGPEPSETDPPIAPPSPLSNLKTLKCPTHNYACKKSICRDMAKLVREEERKAKMGVTDSDGKSKGFNKDEVQNDARKAPTRPFDPNSPRKHDPRTKQKREPSAAGRMRGFSDDEKDVRPARSSHQARTVEVKDVASPVASGSGATSNSWGAPIGTNLDEWGVQSSLDAWS